MSQKGSNTSILSFFQPKPRAVPSTPRRSARLLSSTPKHTTPHPPSSPLSHTATPVPRRMPLEIGASDDEDGDSDFSEDSLEELSALLGRERPNYASSARNLFSTPRTKRTATEFPSSPLTIIPKHKFDLKALAKDARLDNATNASSMTLKATTNAAPEDSTASREDAFGVTFAHVVKQKGDAQKVLRAVQRAGPVQSQARYCFFDRDYRVPPSSPTPKQNKSSPWHLLTRGNLSARERDLASGIPQTILAKKGALPDALFQWFLDELCIQRSSLIRLEYCNMVASCPHQVERLLTPQKLEALFLRLGATEEIRTWKSELILSKPSHEPYQDRDWSCLESFLVLLGMVSGHLSTPSAIYISQVLLRMSSDKLLICNMELLTAYEDTMKHLANAIPSATWDSFCSETCSLLHINIKTQFIRANALYCLSVCDPRTHDLRRRLATTFLFDDPGLGSHHSKEVVTIRSIIDRLSGEDFSIGPQTDFAELKAMIVFLDIATDDGSATMFDDLADEKKFNEDVDELASKLGEIWRKINDSGMKLARTETKSVVEWVQRRLTYSVRTRKKAKESIFDLPGQAEDPFLPRQHDYMANFFRKASKPPQVDVDTLMVKTC